MKFSMNVATPASYFFEKIIDSSLYDIETQTGKKLTINELNNFSFEKTLGNGVQSTFKITSCVVNKVYKYVMTTGRNKYFVSYKVDEINSENINFVYEERLVGKDQVIDANNKLVQALLGWFRKRKLKKMAKLIEDMYQSNVYEISSEKKA